MRCHILLSAAILLFPEFLLANEADGPSQAPPSALAVANGRLTSAKGGRDRIYCAYWLILDGQERSNHYRTLLVTRGPLDDRIGTMIPNEDRIATLDRSAFTFETYDDDSLWDKPFGNVECFGSYDVARRTIAMNDKVYVVSDCPMEVVVRLLEYPAGKLPLHRRVDPLAGAEQTAKGLHRLLRDQVAQQSEASNHTDGKVPVKAARKPSER